MSKHETVATYEAIAPLVTAMLDELRKFAIKKPDATIGQQKVVMINRLLADAKKLLAHESNSKYLDLLSDDALPQYSDAVLILSQYRAAMDAFQERHSEYGKWMLD